MSLLKIAELVDPKKFKAKEDFVGYCQLPLLCGDKLVSTCYAVTVVVSTFFNGCPAFSRKVFFFGGGEGGEGGRQQLKGSENTTEQNTRTKTTTLSPQKIRSGPTNLKHVW